MLMLNSQVRFYCPTEMKRDLEMRLSLIEVELRFRAMICVLTSSAPCSRQPGSINRLPWSCGVVLESTYTGEIPSALVGNVCDYSARRREMRRDWIS